MKITAEGSLGISGPVCGYGQDWCGAQSWLRGGAASGILSQAEYIKINNTAIEKLWQKSQCNGTFGLCELFPPSLSSHSLRFKNLQPVLISANKSFSIQTRLLCCSSLFQGSHRFYYATCAPWVAFCLVLSHRFPSEKVQLGQVKGHQHMGKLVMQKKSCRFTISVLLVLGLQSIYLRL